jgi:CheY-like chemotaxis protein
MPAPDGFAVAQSCRACAPGAEHMIMLLDVKMQRQDASRARDLGVKYTLVKPVAQSDLLDAVMLALGLSGRYAFEVEPDDIGTTSGHAESSGAEGMEILLVEDNPVNQLLAQRCWGHRLPSRTTARGGRPVRDQLRRHPDGYADAGDGRNQATGPSVPGTAPHRLRASLSHAIIAMTANAMQRPRRCLKRAWMTISPNRSRRN